MIMMMMKKTPIIVTEAFKLSCVSRTTTTNTTNSTAEEAAANEINGKIAALSF